MASTWLDKSEYPFTSKYFELNKARYHYIDEGQGEIILFVHGTPSWSFDFRYQIKKLSRNFRCIAVDHIGFGLSDKPENYDYSTLNHSRSLEKFIAALELENLTLVVHDFGGPIGLSWAIRNPDKVKQIVVMNSWLWSSRSNPEFKRMKRILKSPLLPFLYLYLNFSARFILPGSFGAHKLSKSTLKQYTKPFENKSQRFGTLAFAQSLLNDQDWFESLWENRSAIEDKPVLFIWGMRDPVIKPAYLEKFRSGFKQTKVLRLETCGHFPQEEQANEVYEAILNTFGTSYL